MGDILRHAVPYFTGAVLGQLLFRLWRLGKGDSSRAPAAVETIWRTSARMPAGQCQVRITQGGPNKIKDIAAVRKALPTLDLRAGKYIMDHTPELVAAGVGPEAAESLKRQLEVSGMTVEIECRPVPC